MIKSHSLVITLKLIIFIDALPYEIVRRVKNKLPIPMKNPEPLETILGYSSGIKPSIWTGLPPDTHELWNEFFIQQGTIERFSKGLLTRPEFFYIPHAISRVFLSFINLISSRLFGRIIPPGIEPTILPYIKFGKLICNFTC